MRHCLYLLGVNARRYFGHDYGKAYEFIANVSIIINKCSECFGNAVPYIVDKKNNEIETLEAKQYRTLFNKPNFFQDRQNFYISKEIFNF